MADDLGRSLGTGSVYQYQGAAYRVAPWRLRVEAAYKAYLIGRAVAAVGVMREFLPADEYKAQLGQVRLDAEAGLYDFGSPHAWDSVRLRDNLAYLAWLQIGEFDKNFPLAKAAEMAKSDPNGLTSALLEANGINPTTADPSGSSSTTGPTTPAPSGGTDSSPSA